MTLQEFQNRYPYNPQTDRIGGGGFGEVYKAFDRVENRFVAIKVSQVKPEYKDFTLKREVELAKTIPPHQHIAHYEACYSFTTMMGIHDFAVLNFYEYGNLESFLQKNELTDLEKQNLLRGILIGIGFLHDNGITHRDIKSGNILIHREHGMWIPKIADFGLSKAMSADVSFSNSSVGISFQYAAPEQIRGGKLRKNVDLWAYGVIVYRVIVGELPFQVPMGVDAQTARILLTNQIINREFPTRLQTIEAPYKALIDKCWVEDTQERVQSAKELLVMLNSDVVSPIVSDVASEALAIPTIPTSQPIIQPPSTPLVDTKPKPNSSLAKDKQREALAEELTRQETAREQQQVFTQTVPPQKQPTSSSFSMRYIVIALAILGLGVFVFKPTDKTNNEPSIQKSESASPQLPQIEMVFVKGGTFQMGSNKGEDNAKPVHAVKLADFYIGKYEVTQAQWRAVMGNNPSKFKGCDNCPVEKVSWDDVQQFIAKLNELSKAQGQQGHYFLPTEAQWEYAARGGQLSKGYAYSGSNNLDEVGWYDGNSGYKTHAVGGKKGNELGLYDMLGNVWEWCSDWSGSYSSGLQENPTGATEGYYRVFRGGSWFDSAQRCRPTIRDFNTPTYGDDYLGCRLGWFSS